MNEELKRFFDSIKFDSSSFNSAEIEKVIYNKRKDSYEVIIKAPEIISYHDIKDLIKACDNKIKGEKNCTVTLKYDDLSNASVYIDEFLTDFYIDKPSMSKLSVSVDNKNIIIKVSSIIEKEIIEGDTKKILKTLKSQGLEDYTIETSLDLDKLKTIKDEIENESKTDKPKKEEESPIVMGFHKDGEVTKEELDKCTTCDKFCSDRFEIRG